MVSKSENLDHKTFDLAAVLAGRDYPEIEVPVYFNEKLGFSISVLIDAIAVAETVGDKKQAEKLQKELNALVKSVESERYVVTVTGIPSRVRNNILKSVYEAHPEKTDMFGRPEKNMEREELFVKELWVASIVKITAPDGAEVFVDAQEVENLINFAPDTAIRSISDAIEKLSSGSAAGFEYAAREIDFL